MAAQVTVSNAVVTRNNATGAMARAERPAASTKPGAQWPDRPARPGAAGLPGERQLSLFDTTIEGNGAQGGRGGAGGAWRQWHSRRSRRRRRRGRQRRVGRRRRHAIRPAVS